MSELWGHMIGVFIVILMLTFVGVWVWAWRPRHRRSFRRMAHIPMQDDIAPSQQEPSS